MSHENDQSKALLRAVVLVLLALSVLVIARQHRSFDAPYPDIHASSDPRVIERGRHLAYGLAHCATCHGDPTQHAALDAGQEVALTGGHTWHLPIGAFARQATSRPIARQASVATAIPSLRASFATA